MRKLSIMVGTGAALVLVAAVALGAFDPLPTGEPASTGTPVVLGLSHSPRLAWLEPALPEAGHARLSLSYLQGDPDLGAGMVMGTGDTWLGAAVSPLGYVRVWEERPDGAVELLPWQPWPHVRQGDAENEIDVGFEGGKAVVFVNRERLWAGELPVPPATVGRWGAAYGEPATVYFGSLQLFSDADLQARLLQ